MIDVVWLGFSKKKFVTMIHDIIQFGFILQTLYDAGVEHSGCVLSPDQPNNQWHVIILWFRLGH
jgi:hypothetical protein